MSSISITLQFEIHLNPSACYAVYTLQEQGGFKQYIPVTACSDLRYRVIYSSSSVHNLAVYFILSCIPWTTSIRDRYILLGPYFWSMWYVVILFWHHHILITLPISLIPVQPYRSEKHQVAPGKSLNFNNKKLASIFRSQEWVFPKCTLLGP